MTNMKKPLLLIADDQPENLKIIKEEKNGGKIYVTSIEGKGSCFWFDIPATNRL